MSFINKTVTAILSIFPTLFIKKFAMRYVAGVTQDDAIAKARELNDNGFSATLDILGEHATSVNKAIEVKNAYLKLYDSIHFKGLDCNISLKLTHLGLGIDSNLAEKNLFELVDKAKKEKNFLRIDMENSPYTDDTLRLYQTCLERHNGVGIVLQAYLHRSKDDLTHLMGDSLNVRICKGIYHEPANIAFQDREEIRHHFIELVQTALSEGAYVGIATHDRYLIDSLETWIINKAVPKSRYEFQMLYGVPMGKRLERLLDVGHKVRIYLPFGEEWYSYSTRRLEENPHLLGYILKNLFYK